MPADRLLPALFMAITVAYIGIVVFSYAAWTWIALLS